MGFVGVFNVVAKKYMIESINGGLSKLIKLFFLNGVCTAHGNVKSICDGGVPTSVPFGKFAPFILLLINVPYAFLKK